MEFPGVSRKQHVEFLGINQKRSGISKGDQEKNNVEFPWVFVFGLGIFKGSNTILWNIQGLSFVLPGISRDKVKKMKNYRALFTKVYPQSLFFLEQPILRFVYITGQQINKISKQILKDWLSSSLDVTEPKQKQLLHISLIKCDLQNYYLQFSLFSQAAGKCIPSSSSLCTYKLLSRFNFSVLKKP